MKTIHVFLASSIREFEREREQLELFLRNISDHFEARYQVRIRPVLCENIDPAFTTERKQEEYNQIIRNCEIVFFIFFTKLGEFTYEEFLVAKKHFDTYGTPKIYTYFKNLLPGESMDRALADFMDQLDNTFGHYHSTFDHLDTIKLRMLLSIHLQELDFAEVRVENGLCYIGDVSALPLDHVAEFSNNGPLQELLHEYAGQETEYFRLKALYSANQQNPNICRDYAQISARRETLFHEIQKLQEQILRITLNICGGQVQGTITPRQKEAYRLFEQGNLSGCLQILDSADIDREFMAGEAMLEALARNNARKYIHEHMTAIDILSTMIQNPHRYKEIYERYQKILPVAKKYYIEKEVFFRYCDFLTEQRQYWKAKLFLEELTAFYKANTARYSPAEQAQVFLAYGDVFTYMTVHSDAKRAYRKALKFLDAEPENASVKLEAAVKMTECFLAEGRAYRRHFIRQSGSLAYRVHFMTFLYRFLQKRNIHRLDITSTRLLEQDPSDGNRLFRARIHYNYARFYEHHNNKQCIKHYLQALSIAENCENAGQFIEQCLQSIVFFFWLISPSDNIVPYLEQLIEIREKQFLENPDKYFFALSTAYLIACYHHMHDTDQSVFEMYADNLRHMGSTFYDRMNALADVDPESYMRLSDASRDRYLLELADEYPDVFYLISKENHPFSKM